jgi:AAA family ATP:ADP antiporter
MMIGKQKMEPAIPSLDTIPHDTEKKQSVYCMALIIFIYAMLSTFLYFGQALLVNESASGPGDFLRLFASQGIAMNSVVLCMQWFITSRLLQKIGWFHTVSVLPLLLIAGLLALMIHPSLTGIAILMAIHRAASFTFLRPARELWFTLHKSSRKSSIKNFLDTVVYRGGDVAGSWLFITCHSVHPGFLLISLIALAIAFVWLMILQQFGKKQSSQLPASLL